MFSATVITEAYYSKQAGNSGISCTHLSVVDQHIYATGKGKHQAYDSEYQCSLFHRHPPILIFIFLLLTRFFSYINTK